MANLLFWILTPACIIAIFACAFKAAMQYARGDTSGAISTFGWVVGAAVMIIGALAVGRAVLGGPVRVPDLDFPHIDWPAVGKWALIFGLVAVPWVIIGKVVIGRRRRTRTVSPAAAATPLRAVAQTYAPERWTPDAVKTLGAGLPAEFQTRLTAVSADLHDVCVYHERHPLITEQAVRLESLTKTALDIGADLREVPAHLRAIPRGPRRTTATQDALAALTALHEGVKNLHADMLVAMGSDLDLLRRITEDTYRRSDLDLSPDPASEAPAPGAQASAAVRMTKKVTRRE